MLKKLIRYFALKRKLLKFKRMIKLSPDDMYIFTEYRKNKILERHNEYIQNNYYDWRTSRMLQEDLQRACEIELLKVYL